MMMPSRWTSLILAAAVAVLAGAGAAHAQTAWRTQAAHDGRASVEFPAAPAYSTSEASTSRGTAYTIHVYAAEEKTYAVVFQYVTFPPEVNVSNPRGNLQGGVDNAAKGMTGGAFKSVNWSTHQGLPAVHTVGVREGYQVSAFSVMDGPRLYVLTYANKAGAADSEDVERFLKSLRISR